MYDFVCLFPHANASHSLIHYLNQHKLMHVAPYTSVVRALDDVLAYERHIRPFVKTIGVATKDYDTPDIVDKILNASKRDLLIQTVRDPVGSLISQINNRIFTDSLREAMGRQVEHWDYTRDITDALTRYITPAAAEIAYQADTFKRHVVVDVEDLKGDLTEQTVSGLWRMICGDASPENLLSRSFVPLGARRYAQLRGAGFSLTVGNLKLPVLPLAEGDLWVGYYDAKANVYSGREVRLHTYPDAKTVVPSLSLDGPLHVCTFPSVWHALHPKMRPLLKTSVIAAFEREIARFDQAFGACEKKMTFTLEDLSPLQIAMLKAGLHDDFATFMRRHPQVAERWTMTRKFLEV